jgi:hypothetical protein
MPFTYQKYDVNHRLNIAQTCRASTSSQLTEINLNSVIGCSHLFLTGLRVIAKIPIPISRSRPFHSIACHISLVRLLGCPTRQYQLRVGSPPSLVISLRLQWLLLLRAINLRQMSSLSCTSRLGLLGFISLIDLKL